MTSSLAHQSISRYNKIIPMPITTIKDIEEIAMLARLALTSEEKTQYAKDLSAVFHYIDMLSEVDTEQVPETCQVTGLEDVLRDDIVINSSEEMREKLIACFPERVGRLLKVKAVFEN